MHGILNCMPEIQCKWDVSWDVPVSINSGGQKWRWQNTQTQVFINCWTGTTHMRWSKEGTCIFQQLDKVMECVNVYLLCCSPVFSKESNGWDVIKQKWCIHVIQSCWKTKMFICSEKATLNLWRENLAVEMSKIQYLSKYGDDMGAHSQTDSPQGYS